VKRSILESEKFEEPRWEEEWSEKKKALRKNKIKKKKKQIQQRLKFKPNLIMS
jgi:SET domain-containing protein